jgi:hypothetical protein
MFAGHVAVGLAIGRDMGMLLLLPASGLSRAKSVAMAVLCVVILAFTVMGMTVAPPPPTVVAMAGSSLVALGAVVALGAHLGRPD